MGGSGASTGFLAVCRGKTNPSSDRGTCKFFFALGFRERGWSNLRCDEMDTDPHWQEDGGDVALAWREDSGDIGIDRRDGDFSRVW